MAGPFTTEAQVCNVALGRVGHRRRLESLNEDSVEAQLCSTYYPLARDAVLESAWWACNRKRATLAALAGVTRTGWRYVYALPEDCLKERHIWAGLRNPPAGSRIPFELGLNNTDTRLVLSTDQGSPCELIYGKRLETVALMAATVLDAIAWRLAVDLTMSLPVKPQLAAGIEAKARVALLAAVSLDMASQQRDAVPDSETIRARV